MQTDLSLANQQAIDFRLELNNHLEALVTLSSGDSAPSATFPFQLWADTTNDILKIRNEANSAWVVVGTLGATGFGLASLSVAQNWTASQRSAPITDNDGSFDLSGAGNNYTSTPTSAVAITFTNIASNTGKSGYLTLVNGSNYAYTAHANTKITTADLAKIVVSGTYVLPYLCDGTDVFILGVWTKP